MKFTKLRLSGFKSFAEATELAIAPGLTGIVGPNGCGKSNVVEALRWAMGESSAKGLRSSVMDDVIFSGNALRPAFDLAEVSLNLEGPFDGVAAEFDEVQVSRRLNRQGGSHYRINGRETRARDLALIFADAGSGSRSPAIIGQGKIGSIVDCKATERRRLLEDQAGIGGLHDRRREAELKLIATEKNLERLEDALEVHDERLIELNKQAKQAARYAKLSEEIRQLEWLLAVLRLRGAETSLKDVSARHEELRSCEQETANLLAARKQEIRSCLATLEEHRTKLSPLVAAVASMQEKLQSHELELARFDAVGQDLNERLEQTTTDLERERSDRASLIAGSSNNERERSNLDAETQVLRRQKLETRETIEAHAAKLSQLEGRERECSNSLAGLRARENHLRPEVEDAMATLDVVETDQGKLAGSDLEIVDRLQARLIAIDSEIVACEQRSETLEETRRQKQGSMAVLDETVEQRRNERNECQTALHRLSDRHLALARASKTNDQRRRQINGRLGSLNHDLTQARERAKSLDCETLAKTAAVAGEVATKAVATLEQAKTALEALTVRYRQVREEIQLTSTLTAGLEAEEVTLKSALPELEPNPVADRLDFNAANREALTAAFGEELLASENERSAVYWRSLKWQDRQNAADVGLDDWPMLPEGIPSLAECADPDDPLQRRLQQTGVVGRELAEELQASLSPGQQLVSEDGGLWRWDGLVRLPNNANRLQQILDHRSRLAIVQTDLATAREKIAALRPELERIEGARVEQERTVADADQALQQAREASIAARSNVDKALVESQGLEKLCQTLDGQKKELVAELAGLEQPEFEQAQLTSLNAEMAQLNDSLNAANAACDQVDDEKRQLNNDLSGIEQELTSLIEQRKKVVQERGEKQTELESKREHVAEIQARKAALEQKRGAVAANVERLQAGLAQLEAEIAEAQTAHRAILSELADWRQQFQQAQSADHNVRDRLAAIANRLEAIDAEQERNAQLTVRIAEREQSLSIRCSELEKARADNVEQRHHCAEALEELKRAGLSGAEAQLSELNAVIARFERELQAHEQERDRLDSALASIREEAAVARADQARGEATLESCREAFLALRARRAEDVGLSEADLEEPLDGENLQRLEQRLERCRQSRERMGAVNLRAEIEARQLEEQIAAQRREEDELHDAIEKLKIAISTLNKEGRERLVAVFEEVDQHFRKLFQTLFGGGRAHLRLTNLEDPFEAGLELDAMPPGKKLQSLTLLSGGEKSLASLALVMALFLTRPSPLCVLDEVDAALDDVNVERFTRLLIDMARKADTRFLVVTHHPQTMAIMDRLYGVTMQERGVSKIVSVALDQAVTMRESA